MESKLLARAEKIPVIAILGPVDRAKLTLDSQHLRIIVTYPLRN